MPVRAAMRGGLVLSVLASAAITVGAFLFFFFDKPWTHTLFQRPSDAERCLLLERPKEFDRGDGQRSSCDDLIPRYDMSQWLREHGNVAPDHPAIFVNTNSREADVFKDPGAFLALHGEERLLAKPEYMQSGGHLQDPTSPSNLNVTLRQLAKIWDATHLYISDFQCKNGSLCARVAEQFGQPALFRGRRLISRNFLVGGMGSGLPFHRHSATWQGLSLGRKAWYIIPPGSMTEAMHNLTGPFVFPARTYHNAILKEPVGRRPLFCVQHPGEVIYFPDWWWHATMNLDGYEVAYGEKPWLTFSKGRSTALAKIMQVFPLTSWDYTGEALPTGRSPAVYNIMPQLVKFRQTCGNTSSDLDRILRSMLAPSNAHGMACGLSDVVAWAHCRMVSEVRNTKRRCKQNITESKLAELSERMESWTQKAKELSDALTLREGKKCR